MKEKDLGPKLIRDKELIEAAQRDPMAFGAIYEIYCDRVYNYIYQRTGNRYDTEDLTARTFLKAFSSLDRFKWKGAPLSAWLYRIAHNAVVNWHRNKGRHPEVSLGALFSCPTEGEGPEEQVEREEKNRKLFEAIRELPFRYHLVIFLKHWEDLKNAEIGQIMGISEGAVKSLYHRGLLALRRRMKGKQD